MHSAAAPTLTPAVRQAVRTTLHALAADPSTDKNDAGDVIAAFGHRLSSANDQNIPPHRLKQDTRLGQRPLA